MLRKIVVAALLMLALVSHAWAQTSTLNVPYGADPAQIVDIYQPAGTPTCAIVLIHGGGFYLEDKKTANVYVGMFRSRGCVVFNANYRLMVPASNPSIAPVNPYPAQLDDMELLLGWIGTNAATYKVSGLKIVAVGMSAGGTIAQYLGLRHEVAGVISISGPGDLWAVWQNLQTLASMPGYAWNGLSYVSGQKTAIADVSPISHIAGGEPPIMIVQGVGNGSNVAPDPYVKLADAQALYNAYRAVKDTVGWENCPGGHVCGEADPTAMQAVEYDIAHWMMAVIYGAT